MVVLFATYIARYLISQRNIIDHIAELCDLVRLVNFRGGVYVGLVEFGERARWRVGWHLWLAYMKPIKAR